MGFWSQLKCLFKGHDVVRTGLSGFIMYQVRCKCCERAFVMNPRLEGTELLDSTPELEAILKQEMAFKHKLLKVGSLGKLMGQLGCRPYDQLPEPPKSHLH